jgi:cardiolipin synthase
MSRPNMYVPQENPRVPDQEKRAVVRFWQWLDYICWLPLGTDPTAMLALQEMRQARIAYLHADAEPPEDPVLRGWELFKFIVHDVLVDVPKSAVDTAKKFGVDRRWVYRVFDPVMVFLLLPTLFILSGLMLGGGIGVAFSALVLLAILWILILRLRMSARDGVEVDSARPEAILTLPNALTFGRLVLILLFPMLMYDGHPLRAVILFGALASTDWADGFIARHYNLGSHFGKTIDPVADRVMVLVVVITILAHGNLQDEVLSGWPLGLIVGGFMVAREATLSLIAVLFLRPSTLRGDPKGSTHPSGKIGFAVNCLGIVLLLAIPPLPHWTAWIAIAILAAGTLLNWYAIVLYVRGIAERRRA